MNSSGIIPPREGVENLAAARKALTGKEVSSSHITDAIIKTDSALEALFRQYLSEMIFVPRDARNRADDHFETSFPELVRAMSAYGKPSLCDRESEILNLNQIRNQHAHGLATSTITSRAALAYVELAEETYSKYSQFNLRRSTINSVPQKIMNPFIKELQKARWFSSYPSDDNYRAVWLKGQKAKVPGKGSFRCPIREFDTIAFVWMNAVQLPIDLSGMKFLSSDSVDIEVQLELTANVKDSELALITVATRFDDSLALVKADAATIVREFFRARRAASIPGIEAELASEIAKRMALGAASSTFKFLKASLQLQVPIIEQAANQEIASAIGHEQARKREERWTPKLRPEVKLDFSRTAQCEKEQIHETKTQTV